MATPFKDIARGFLSPAPYLSWAGLSAILAVSGPFGTYDSCPLALRAQCFGILVGIGLVWGVTGRTLVQSLFPRLAYWQAAGIVILLSAVVLPAPLTALAPALTRMPPDQLPSFAETAVIVFVFGVGAALVRRAMGRDGLPKVIQVPQAGSVPRLTGRDVPAGPAPRLFARLDPALGTDLVRLAARDHYVDVTTVRGTGTVLMRLTDAIAELDGVRGLRVHRSHWVADAAVRGAEVQADRTHLVMSDGARVPVARPMIAEAEARGLIQRGIGTGRAAAPVRTAMASASKRDDKAGSELVSPPV